MTVENKWIFNTLFTDDLIINVFGLALFTIVIIAVIEIAYRIEEMGDAEE